MALVFEQVVTKKWPIRPTPRHVSHPKTCANALKTLFKQTRKNSGKKVLLFLTYEKKCPSSPPIFRNYHHSTKEVIFVLKSVRGQICVQNILLWYFYHLFVSTKRFKPQYRCKIFFLYVKK